MIDGPPIDDARAAGNADRRLKVLVIAEAANPEWSSVPLVGWKMFTAINSIAVAHLVTQVRNGDAIARTGLPRDQYTIIDSEAIARPIHKLSSILRGSKQQAWTIATALRTLSYPYFERLVWRQLGDAIRRREFDVVHRVTPVSPAIASPLASRCRQAGVPFILGPINGGVPWPAAFRAVQRRERELLSSVRGLHRLSPSYRRTRRDSTAILCGSGSAWNEVAEQYRAKTIYLPENAVDDAWLVGEAPAPPASPLRVVFVGRLVALKGVDMLIEASRELLADGSMTLDIAGDGPERAALEALAAKLGVGDKVRFHGWVDQAGVRQRLEESHVLGFPSIREFGGGVVLEAMALGVVPLVLAYGGPTELISPECGVGVEMGTRDEIVQRFREQLARLAKDPAEVKRQSQRARERARQFFTWQVKARQIETIYRWAIDHSNGTAKPNFGMPLGVGAGNG